MKAAVVSRRGGPEVIELRTDLPEPTVKDPARDVVVEVEAVGVNFADTLQTQGMYPHGPRPPYIPGLEFAGTIAGTKDRVMGFTEQGACAERVAVRKDTLIPVPRDWTAAEAAAFPVNYYTVYFAYWMAGMLDNAAGKKVLIHAVAGGVGTAAVEVGKLLGVEMFGTSSSNDKLDQVKALGLHHGINYKTSDFEEEIARLTGGAGVDAVFEMLGGEDSARSTRCLAEMGRLIVYGMASGQAPQFEFMAMFQKNLSVHTLWLMPLARHRDLMQQAYVRLSQWIASGGLRPVVGATLPLEKTAEAHRMLTERRNYGKVVLTVR